MANPRPSRDAPSPWAYLTSRPCAVPCSEVRKRLRIAVSRGKTRCFWGFQLGFCMFSGVYSFDSLLKKSERGVAEPRAMLRTASERLMTTCSGVYACWPEACGYYTPKATGLQLLSAWKLAHLS